jgi:ketosteroid isomerase-like protein
VIEQLLARQAIADLAVRYSMAVDDHDIETVLSCFTPDGVFVRRGVEVSGAGLRPFFQRMAGRYGLTVHTVHGHLVTVDGQTATGVQAGSAELFHQGTMMRAAYRYRDSYVCRHGRWLFGRRELGFAYAVPAGQPFPAGVDRIRWPDVAPETADYPETLPTW